MISYAKSQLKHFNYKPNSYFSRIQVLLVHIKLVYFGSDNQGLRLMIFFNFPRATFIWGATFINS